jgi:formylglycine-generating enzyme required for sulfatase activity
MEHDTLCGRAVLHGGADYAYANNLGDSWSWDGAAWTQMTGSSPAPRHGASMVFDAQRAQWILWGGRQATGFLADTWQLASSCSRTMSLVQAPQVGATAQLRYQYPQSAALHYYFHLVTAPQSGSYPVPIPGIPSIGLARVDLFNMYSPSSNGFLDTSGSSLISFSIPRDNWFAGIPLDIQSADLNFLTSTLYWASNDLEVTIAAAPPPPVASFTQDRVLGAAPMTVQFTDTSTGAPTGWQWDFDNNGTVDSTVQNPSHTYTQNGIYSVRLVASNLGGSTTSVQTNLINVGPSPNPLLNMIEIQPGSFSMGSTAGTPYEQPVHPVAISRTFWIGKFEVTQAQYASLVGSNPSFHQGVSYPNAPQRPVERLSQAQAKAYCTALTAAEGAAGRLPPGYVYRLPTEAEWEYCCRAGTTTEWHTGLALGAAQANWRGLLANALNAYGQTSVVGSYPANAFGLHDMHGNVWEWCLDTWLTGAGYAPGAATDPIVTNGTFAVCRGGSWHLFSSGDCRSAYRNFYGFAGTSSSVIGFRVVLGPPMGP